MALDTTEQFDVQSLDRIGFTNEATFGVISFRYVQGHRTYFRKVEQDGTDDYPIENNNYRFDNIYLPAIFAIAAEVDPSKCGVSSLFPSFLFAFFFFLLFFPIPIF